MSADIYSFAFLAADDTSAPLSDFCDGSGVDGGWFVSASRRPIALLLPPVPRLGFTKNTIDKVVKASGGQFRWPRRDVVNRRAIESGHSVRAVATFGELAGGSRQRERLRGLELAKEWVSAPGVSSAVLSCGHQGVVLVLADALGVLDRLVGAGVDGVAISALDGRLPTRRFQFERDGSIVLGATGQDWGLASAEAVASDLADTLVRHAVLNAAIGLWPQWFTWHTWVVANVGPLDPIRHPMTEFEAGTCLHSVQWRHLVSKRAPVADRLISAGRISAPIFWWRWSRSSRRGRGTTFPRTSSMPRPTGRRSRDSGVFRADEWWLRQRPPTPCTRSTHSW